MWLALFEASWADEFDVYGFRLLTDAQKEFWDKEVDNNGDSYVSWSFGTNEGFEGETAKDFNDYYSFEQISDEEGETIKKFIGFEYGNFPYLPDLIKESEDW